MKAILCCIALFVVAVSATSKPIPVFPNAWTATEEDFMVVYQGSYQIINNNYCCGDDSCEVQTEYQSGTDYFDYPNNRTRFDDPVNGMIVSLFAPTYKEMLVDANNNCQAFCPIEDDLYPYQIDPNATYAGQKVIDGKTLDDWNFEDKEFGIVFEIEDIYVDPNSGLPYKEMDQLTPFGQAIGESESTYHTFTAGEPDPKKFAVNGIANCPEDPNCGDSFRQFTRRRWGLRRTWMRHFQAQSLAKVKAQKAARAASAYRAATRKH